MAAYYQNGRYRVVITKQALAENKRGNPEVQLTIRPEGYYEKNELHAFESTDYERTVYLTLTEGTIGTASQPGWVFELLKFLGFEGSSFGQLDPEAKDAISFVGKEVDAICNVEEHDGKEREKWSIYRGSTGTPPKPLEKKGIKALDAKFKQLLSRNKPKGASVGAPEPATDPITSEELSDAPVATLAPPPDKDIPF